MKSKLIVGMLAMSFIAAPTFAAPTTAAAHAKTAKAVTEYKEKVRTSYFGKGVTKASALSAQAAKAAKDKVVADLELATNDRSKVAELLMVKEGDQASKDLADTRLDVLVGLSATRTLAKSWIASKDATARSEGEALLASTDTLIQTLINSKLTGHRETSALLNKAELTLTKEATRNLEAIADSIPTMKESGPIFVEVLARRNELLRDGRLSAEEALLQSIMDVRKVSKEKAMEIIRKMKDCVA
jgi:hypothetical protein